MIQTKPKSRLVDRVYCGFSIPNLIQIG